MYGRGVGRNEVPNLFESFATIQYVGFPRAIAVLEKEIFPNLDYLRLARLFKLPFFDADLSLGK